MYEIARPSYSGCGSSGEKGCVGAIESGLVFWAN